MNASIEEAARLYTARDLPRAARVCLDILRDTPKHYDTLHLLGAICASRGQYADGVSYLLRAAALNPQRRAPSGQSRQRLGHGPTLRRRGKRVSPGDRAQPTGTEPAEQSRPRADGANA